MKNTLKFLCLSLLILFSCNDTNTTNITDDEEEEETINLDDVIYNVPVFVNVVYKNNPLEEEVIENQIQFLNDVFAGRTTNLDDVPEQFRATVAGDIKIRFFLEGIAQRETTKDSFDDTAEIAREALGIEATDTGSILNIWVAVLDGADGDSTFPEDLADEDLFLEGVYIDRSAFGVRNGIGIRNEGKQLVHEIGHFFNLFHLPGLTDDTSGCEFDDGVDDTPNSQDIYFGRPEQDSSSCNSKDMFMNFMENVFDDTRIMFTKGQKARMRATLVNGGVRATYVESTTIEE